MNTAEPTNLSPTTTKWHESDTKEVYDGEHIVPHDGELRRQLKSRHIGMIA